MTPPHCMLEVGAEGDRFNPHAESPTCVEQGCVPADAPAPDEASQRLLTAAQAVVTASHEVYLVPHPAFEQAMQALEAVLREGEP